MKTTSIYKYSLSSTANHAKPEFTREEISSPYISKNGKTHDAVEHWLGRHNRKFEMLRTVTSFVSASASSIVLLKVFGLV